MDCMVVKKRKFEEERNFLVELNMLLTRKKLRVMV